MEEFINAKDLQRIMNEASPSIHIGYGKARSLFRKIKDQYDCDGLLLPYDNVIPLAWNALFEFKTDGKNVKLKVHAMTGNDIASALLNAIDELHKQNAVNLAFLMIGIAMINEQEDEVMGNAQGKA